MTINEEINKEPFQSQPQIPKNAVPFVARNSRKFKPELFIEYKASQPNNLKFNFNFDLIIIIITCIQWVE